MTIYINPSDTVIFIVRDLVELTSDLEWSSAVTGVTGDVNVLTEAGGVAAGPYAIQQVGVTDEYFATGAAPAAEGRYRVRFTLQKGVITRTIWDDLVVDVGAG